MKTLVIFDVDGTLIYSETADSQCFADSYEAVFGKPLPSIDWENYNHVTDHTIFNSVFEKQFNRSVTTKELDIFQTHFVNKMQEARAVNPAKFRIMPGAKETIEKLSQDDRFAVGIATGGWQRPAQFKLRYKDIDYAKTFDSYADNKPTRHDIINESIKKAKAVHTDFQRIVYVGDAKWDVRTTREMDLPLIGIRWRGDFDYLAQEGATHILKNFLDYEAFLHHIAVAETPRFV